MVSFSLHDSPLFVTHPDRVPWYSFLSDVGKELGLRSDIHWIIYGSQTMIDALRLPENKVHQQSLCVPDAPESGNIPNHTSFIKELFKAFKSQTGRKKKAGANHSVCVIDDLWELLTHLQRTDGRKLLKIIRESNGTDLHLILGSSPGNRTLIQQIYQNNHVVHRKKMIGHPAPEVTIGQGSEIILGTEGLIFSSTPGGKEWEKWYAPRNWHPTESLNNGRENERNPDQMKEGITQSSQRPLEADAQIFDID